MATTISAPARWEQTSSTKTITISDRIHHFFEGQAKNRTGWFLLCVMLLCSIRLFAQGPAITSFSPASGAVGTLVTINGANLSAPTAFSIGGVTALVINNTGTVLTGFVMPGAVTGVLSLTTGSGTATSSGNFTVTPTLRPGAWSQQGGKLVGTGNTGAENQGWSVSLSADGNRAIVGGPGDNGGRGAAWVYTRSGGVWSQQGGKLVGTGNTGAANQGISVSLRANGNTAIVGGTGDNGYRGAAWVYTRSGGAWSQQGGKLVGTGNAGAPQQGCSVSLSADGNTAIVGGFQDNSSQGAAWVYTRSGGAWSQQGGKLVGTGNTGAAQQGYSVSLSADGNTAIMGGFRDNNYQGATWVYTRSGGVWSQQGHKLVGTGSTAAANQGSSVSLSADGNTAIVGGYYDNSNQGAAWVYTRSGGAWSQQGGKLVGTGNTGAENQGFSVSLSADGNTAIVGGIADNSNQGAAWVYTRSGGAWSQQGGKLTGTGNTGAAYQGWSVSLSADGKTAIVGGPYDNSSQGAVWAYTVASSNDKLALLKISKGIFAPAFSAGNLSYTDAVGNLISSVTVTPTAADPTATIQVNGTTVASGTASKPINVPFGTSTINVKVTAQNGTTSQTYTIAVSRPANSNADLSSLKMSSGRFSWPFDRNVTSYTDTVGNVKTTVKVIPTTLDTGARVTVNGIPVISGTESSPVSLAFGHNTILVKVAAEDGKTTKTYTVTVTRTGTANSVDNLSSLKMSKGIFSPTFASATTSYTDAVGNTITSVTVTPTTTDPTATVKVNGTVVASGTASGAINLAVGANAVNVVVTASDGTTTKTYTVTVNRASSNNDNLSSLKMSKGTFSPTFASATTSYTDAVNNPITSVTVTPTASDPDATIKINGTTVASGTASGAINLAVGANTINVAVTASDKVTTKTYTVTVNRASGGADSYGPGISVTKPTETPALAEDGIQVHQGLSPNGDGINDFLMLDGIQAYPDNKLSIMNRNGRVVYEAKGYDNAAKAFDGHSNKNGKMQLPGTYFYQLDYTVNGAVKHKTGFIVLKY